MLGVMEAIRPLTFKKLSVDLELVGKFGHDNCH